MDIPKIIHQTYHTENFPDKIKENIDSLLTNNPDWEYRFYSDDHIINFISKECNHEIYDAYMRINPIYGSARADFFRYLVMYLVGGVYLDIKSSAIVPLERVINLNDQYVLSYWPNLQGEPFQGWGFLPELNGLTRGELQNWHIICEPKHPFLFSVITNVLNNIKNYSPEKFGVGHMGVLRTTGPIIYTQSIVPIMPGVPHRLAGSHLDMGLKYNIWEEHGVVAHKKWMKNNYSTLQEPIVI